MVAIAAIVMHQSQCWSHVVGPLCRGSSRSRCGPTLGLCAGEQCRRTEVLEQIESQHRYLLQQSIEPHDPILVSIGYSNDPDHDLKVYDRALTIHAMASYTRRYKM